MRKIISLAIFLITCSWNISKAQQQPSWQEWRTLYEEGVPPNNYKIEISFSQGSCFKGELAGTVNRFVRWKIRSNFTRPKAYCKFSFEVVGCDGKVSTTNMIFSMEKPGLFEDRGYFSAAYEARKINSVKIDDYSLKPASNSPPSNSGSSATKNVEIKPTENTPSQVNNNNGTNLNKKGSNNTATINKELNQKLENTQNTYQAINDGLQQLGELLQANNEKKIKEQNVARERQEQKEEEERLRKIETERKNTERIKQLEEETNEKAETIKRELDRQWRIDTQILSNYLIRKTTSDIPDNLKQVYYLIYQRNYNNNKVTVRSYTLNKYSDNTWMLQGDLMSKLQFTPYFNSDGVGQLLGFYSSRTQAEAAIKQIKSAVSTENLILDTSFIFLSSSTPAVAGSDKDFWNH